MSTLLKFFAIFVVLNHFQYVSPISDFLDSSDYVCPCGCEITDKIGNVIALTTTQCKEGQVKFFDEISFDCPCGCYGKLPNGYHYNIYPSKTKCANQSVVKVLNSPIDNCTCGCKDKKVGKIVGFTINVTPQYVLKNNVPCFNNSQLKNVQFPQGLLFGMTSSGTNNLPNLQSPSFGMPSFGINNLPSLQSSTGLLSGVQSLGTPSGLLAGVQNPQRPSDQLTGLQNLQASSGQLTGLQNPQPPPSFNIDALLQANNPKPNVNPLSQPSPNPAPLISSNNQVPNVRAASTFPAKNIPSTGPHIDASLMGLLSG